MLVRMTAEDVVVVCAMCALGAVIFVALCCLRHRRETLPRSGSTVTLV